jgi:hypothetical protein
MEPAFLLERVRDEIRDYINVDLWDRAATFSDQTST